ncbi:serine hydrolase [Candidatus Pacearchaeota archaeon]|nr:serine hydrolase [Candidatus Pacearchaeota archaeon]
MKNRKKIKNKALQKGLEKVVKLAENEIDADIKVSVHDLTTGEIASVNGKKFGWAASIIKVPVMVSALKEIYDGDLSLKTKLPINHEFLLEHTDYVSGLPLGTKLSVAELIYHMMVTSDNEATNILADYIGGPQTINKTMRELGMKKSMLGHLLCSGVPRYTSKINPDGSNITTPDDMVKVMRHIYDPNFSKLAEPIRKAADRFFSFTSPSFLDFGGFKKKNIKAKVGHISDHDDGSDIHEVGIINNDLIVCMMANKVKTSFLGSIFGGPTLSRYDFGDDFRDDFDDEDLMYWRNDGLATSESFSSLSPFSIKKSDQKSSGDYQSCDTKPRKGWLNLWQDRASRGTDVYDVYFNLMKTIKDHYDLQRDL